MGEYAHFASEAPISWTPIEWDVEKQPAVEKNNAELMWKCITPARVFKEQYTL